MSQEMRPAEPHCAWDQVAARTGGEHGPDVAMREVGGELLRLTLRALAASSFRT